MLIIKKAEYIGDYTIRLIFNNGKKGKVDLEKIIFEDKRPIFSKLKNKNDFKNFQIKYNTVTWNAGLDLAPEYLFYLAFKEDMDLQNQFKQ